MPKAGETTVVVGPGERHDVIVTMEKEPRAYPGGDPEEEHKAAMEHLQKALNAIERERQQAKEQLERELAIAMQQSAQDQEKLAERLRERNLAFEKLEADHNVLQAVHDVHKGAAEDAQKRVDVLQAANAQLNETLRGRDAEVAALNNDIILKRAALADTKRSADELQAENKKLADALAAKDALVSALQNERAMKDTELTATRKDFQVALQASQQRLAALEVEVATARKEQRAESDAANTLRSTCDGLRGELNQLQQEVQAQTEKSRLLHEVATKKEGELAAARGDLSVAVAEGERHRARLADALADVAARDAKLATEEAHHSATRSELSKVQAEGEAHRVRIAEVLADVTARDAELAIARRDLNKAICEGEAHRTSANKMQGEVGTLQRELDSLKPKFNQAQMEAETGKTNIKRIERELQVAEMERNKKIEAADKERRWAEALNAKVESLEEALRSEKTRQEDAALERHMHKERADRLEDTIGRLRKTLDDRGDVSLASTAPSTLGGSEATITPRYRNHPLPPVRPTSASRTPVRPQSARGAGPLSPSRNMTLSVSMGQ